MDKIKYRPRFAGAIRGHAINASKKWMPTLAATHEFDDLLQEAWLVFHKCREKYTVVDNPAWFMSLYCRSLENKLITLAKRATRYHQRYIPIEHIKESEVPVTQYDEGFMRVVLSELPVVQKKLLSALLSGPDTVKENWAYRQLKKLHPV